MSGLLLLNSDTYLTHLQTRHHSDGVQAFISCI